MSNSPNETKIDISEHLKSQRDVTDKEIRELMLSAKSFDVETYKTYSCKAVESINECIPMINSLIERMCKISTDNLNLDKKFFIRDLNSTGKTLIKTFNGQVEINQKSSDLKNIDLITIIQSTQTTIQPFVNHILELITKPYINVEIYNFCAYLLTSLYLSSMDLIKQLLVYGKLQL